MSRACVRPGSILLFGAFAISCLAFGQQWTQQQSPEPVYGQSTSQQNSSQRNPNTTQDQSGDAACDPTDTQAGDCNMPWEERTTPDRTRRPSNTSEIPQTNRAEPLPKDKRLENPQSQKVIDPPTEFQKFVERSVGKRLPIYGASLFNRVPSTYAPSDQVPAANDYAIGPGDELDIRVWGQINFERKLTVDRSGEIFIPQVGRVSVTGLAFSDLPNALKTSIGRVYRNFEVSVSLGQLRSIQIFVMGHARRPGAYTVSALSTLVNALFVSGGPSPQGSMRNIELKRGGQVVTHFNLYDLLLHGDKTKDAPLKTGDVVFIAPVGARVAVTGSVENPAIYEISAGESLREALADAGGLSPTAAAQKAFLERIDNHSLLVSEDIGLSGSGLDTKLQNGDILQLLNVVPRFSRTVSLKGNVADPVRMAWHDGMRISDLIPDKAALLTRDYWTEHNRLAPKAIDVTAAAPDTEEERHTEDQDAPPANVTSRERGVTQRRFTKKNDYQQPAPDINWTYAVIERLDEQTLSTRLIPFNLGKVVLEHDEAANLALQPGDVVKVFSLADFTTPVAAQSRVVRLEGEVKMAGIYSVRPGETLRQVVERAGGFTEKAYLYAAEFTRESTKREQQKRLNDYLDQTEKELDQSSSTVASRSITPQQEEAARAQILSQYAAIERLRKTEATGRIVLELKPDSQGVAALPDLELQNGDRLLVPMIPVTVSVIGTVYNQSTFLYESGSSVRVYLKRSGGPTKYADATHMFMIRADGSVLARAGFPKFEALAVWPGDAVVVPPNYTKTSKIRNFVDWSQVLSGFGIAAAAVNVLK